MNYRQLCDQSLTVAFSFDCHKEIKAHFLFYM